MTDTCVDGKVHRIQAMLSAKASHEPENDTGSLVSGKRIPRCPYLEPDAVKVARPVRQ